LKAWEGREEIGYQLDFLLEIVRLSSLIAHYFHIWMVDDYSFSAIDIAMFVFAKSALSELWVHIQRFNEYMEATHLINKYSCATEEELHGIECIICYEPMTVSTSKKLGCNHIFHVSCIKKWMQKAFNCPVCRHPLVESHKHLKPSQEQQDSTPSSTESTQQASTASVQVNPNEEVAPVEHTVQSTDSGDNTETLPSTEAAETTSQPELRQDPTVYRIDQTTNPWMKWLPFSVELEEWPSASNNEQEQETTLRNRSQSQQQPTTPSQ